MKKILYMLSSAALILSGCNGMFDDNTINGGKKGSLSFNVACKEVYVDAVTKAAQTDEEIINSFVIDIERPFDGWTKSYPAFSEIKGTIIELGSGAYNLIASSPEKKDAAFDQPIYMGKKGFDIRAGEVTNVDLVCTIDNVKMTIILSSNFYKELSDYTVTVSNGKGHLSWTKDAEVNDFESVVEDGKTVYRGKKAGYFTKAPLTITVTGHREIDNSFAQTMFNIDEVASAEHHIVTLDAKVTGSVSGINIGISHEVRPVYQNVVVPGFSEMQPGVPGDPSEGGEPTAPTLVWEANPDFNDIELPMAEGASTKLDGRDVPVELVINAPNGIKSFKIYVKSNVLTPTIAALTEKKEAGIVDGVVIMDMINDDVLYGNLGIRMEDGVQKGSLPMKDMIENKTSVEFSLTKLVPMINMYVADITAGDVHEFTLEVEDNEGETLTKTVKIVSVTAN